MNKHKHRNVFAAINDVSCYWAGFIAADGYVVPNNGVLGCRLSGKDHSHLEKLQAALSCTNPVRNEITKAGYSSSTLQVTAAQDLIQSLGQNFNITPHKSLTLEPPTNLEDKSCVCAFIRGYMDGDGYISQYGGKKKPNTYVGFAGTNAMMSWIKCNIQTYVVVGNPSIYKHKNANIHQLIFGGRQAERILDWLYMDSTPLTRLDRKYAKYQELR